MASAGFRAPPSQCGSCHNEEPSATAKPIGSRGGELLQLWRAAGELRRKTSHRIERIKDSARRHDLEEGFFLADAPYQEAIDDGHGFRWDDWEENIRLAHDGFAAVYGEAKKKR